MNEELLVEKLNTLADYHAQLDYLKLKRQELIKQVVPPEIQAVLDDIELEFQAKVEAVTENIQTLKDEIEVEVAKHGATVTGANLQAVYRRGSVSWDTRRLEGYAVSHPEIGKFRRVGNPNVAIVRNGKDK